jgi:hypothetical protein
MERITALIGSALSRVSPSHKDLICSTFAKHDWHQQGLAPTKFALAAASAYATAVHA